MADHLRGRFFLVTGASGIAAAGARRLASQGAGVLVVSRSPDKCEALTAEIRATDGVCEWHAADLREEAATEAAMVAFRQRFDRLDGLLAVAGGSGRRYGDGPLHEIPLSGWETTLAQNGHPAFLAAREAVRTMLEQEPDTEGSRGSVVLVSSVLPAHPAPDHFATHAYSAVKGAVIALTRTMASYYARYGIRVNAIAPGLVDTPMAERAAQDPVIVAYAERKQPLASGLLDPENVAGAAVFFLSSESSTITGQVLEVDGGWGVTEAAP